MPNNVTERDKRFVYLYLKFISTLKLQLVCRCMHKYKHTHAHTELYPHHNPISFPHWWCRLSVLAVIGEQREWQRSSTNDGSLIKSASNTYYCTILLPWRQEEGMAESYHSFAPCAWPLKAHANQCQSMPVWIGRAIYHNRWTALPSGQVSHMGPAEKDGSCQAVTFLWKSVPMQNTVQSLHILVWYVCLFLQFKCIWPLISVQTIIKQQHVYCVSRKDHFSTYTYFVLYLITSSICVLFCCLKYSDTFLVD